MTTPRHLDQSDKYDNILISYILLHFSSEWHDKTRFCSVNWY